MTGIDRPKSADIYAFRIGAGLRRPRRAAAGDAQVVSFPTPARPLVSQSGLGGAWYHELALRDAERERS